MSITLRGRATAPSGVPRGWRGPLPDISAKRRLPELDGYASVPAELLHGGFPSLGILTWTLLRLSFDDRQDAASYPEFADALGLGELTTSAIQQRFQPALAPLMGTWITRQRAEDNVYLYRAIVPPAAGKRYAMLRRSDLALLQLRPRGRGAKRITVSHLADFARWQLECGQRGWTADPLSSIAARWAVGDATLRRSRDALVDARLLEVTARPGGRYTDLVWLRELYDPHWAVPSESTPTVPQHVATPRSDEPQPTEVAAANQRLIEPISRDCGSRLPEVVGAATQTPAAPPARGPIRNLTGGSLTEDLSELGGASATPLTLLPRGMGDAAPQAAARAKDRSSASRPAGDPLQFNALRSQQPDESAPKVAGRLLAQHRHLSSAPRHYVKAMVKLLARDLDRGLHPGHIARALERCVSDGEVGAHCELVRLAVRQAWGDQRAGACGECGADVGEHRMGCAHRAAEVDASVDDEEAAKIHAAVLASLNLARASGPFLEVGWQVEAAPAQPPDPLAGYLSEPPEPDWSVADDGEVASWLTSRLAVAVADATDRLAALQTVWRLWRSEVAPQHLDLVDAAAAHLRLVLEERRAS